MKFIAGVIAGALLGLAVPTGAAVQQPSTESRCKIKDRASGGDIHRCNVYLTGPTKGIRRLDTYYYLNGREEVSVSLLVDEKPGETNPTFKEAAR